METQNTIKTERYTWSSDLAPTNRYVIIGNGFDLECGLPTSYAAYLKFISCYRDLSQWFKEKCKSDPLTQVYYNENRYAVASSFKPSLQSIIDKYSEVIDNSILKQVNPLNHVATSNIEAVEMGAYDEYFVIDAKWSQAFDQWSEMFNNIWYRYLSEASMGRGWVDFEDEIKKIIDEVERSMAEEQGRRRYLDSQIIVEHPSKLSSIIENMFPESPINESIDYYGTNRSFRRYDVTYRSFRNRLINDLVCLTKGLETYLRDYVSAVEANVTPAIERIIEAIQSCNNASIISFNYTDTLERLLQKRGIEAEFCYVHGRLGNAEDKNRMVLGFSEKTSEMKDSVDFASFRKYNQRIFKGTDSTYRDWLIQIYDNGFIEPCELLIFGHSLGVTDGDIIRSFIQAPNIRTVVYYHDEDAFSEELANATAILGADYVIDKTGGKNRTLRFAEQ